MTRDAAFLDLHHQPALRLGVRLHRDQVRSQWIILAPERVFELDDIGAAIVKRLDGQSSMASIAADLAQEYTADPAIIERDLLTFVKHLQDSHLLR